ncbi:glutamine--fructose-6-phosphate aminotransferase [Lactobacillus sp.] [Lactiplantibacillus mudanjiangensis]|uniref:SIS domain-containing protein n=1 Tax=Lactiplantibacillus mudanjiangensis TaxID=1296538 RepID=UPI001014E287|nr:SIS domain-containing protein [Lactiplantibacillus mudanjiangensis]VDG32196.1 glutamine--fructose-6-phosphate aminotransferase [Lactobacillus sp.] [Lactiplantibacillus mudanjiangensis]
MMMMNNPTMLSYIRREQSVLNQILAAYPEQIGNAMAQAPEDTHHWLILTTASSLNAAKSARLYMEHTANIQVDVQDAEYYANYGHINPGIDTVIAISLSGEDPDTIAALKKVTAGSHAYTIAMTSQVKSQLPTLTDATVDILTGKETIPYITLSYSALMLSLMFLGLRSAANRNLMTELAANQELDEFGLLIEHINETIQRSNDYYRKFTIDFGLADQFTAIGPSVVAGTLAEMETKFTEIVRVPTNGYTVADFTHGAYLGAHENHRQFYIELNTLPNVMQKQAAVKTFESNLTPHIYTISFTGEQPTEKDEQTLILHQVDDVLKAPLLAIIPFQVLAWFIAKAKGINLSHSIFTKFQTVVDGVDQPK